MHALRAAGTLLLAVAVAAMQGVPVGAQAPPNPAAATVDVRVDEARLTVSLDAAAVTKVIVVNTATPNQVLPQLDQPRRVTLEVTGAPEGWTVAVEPNSFLLGPGTSGQAELRVAVTGSARDDVARLNVTARLYPLGVDAVPGAGPVVDPEARDDAPVTVTRQDSVNRAVTEAVGPYILLVLGSVLLLAIAVGVLLFLRGRAAVRLDCAEAEATAKAGRAITFPLHVANVSGRDDVVALRFAVPDGWRASFSQPQLELAPGAEADLTLSVHVPKGAGADRHEVLVTAVSSLPRKASAIRLVVQVT